MADVYSVRFFEDVGLSPGSYLAYTVPDGYVAILRDIDAYSSAGVSDAEIYVEGHLGQTIFYGNVAATSKSNAQWRGRQVLQAGETITITVGASTDWDVTISGYLLVAP